MTAIRELRQKRWAAYLPGVIVFVAVALYPIFRPPLDGRQVMEHLGIPPGRIVGEALDALLEERLERGPIEEAEAYALLDAWARDRGVARA